MRADIAHDQCDRLLAARMIAVTEITFETEDAKLSPARGEIGFSHFADGGGTHNSIISRSAGEAGMGYTAAVKIDSQSGFFPQSALSWGYSSAGRAHRSQR